MHRYGSYGLKAVASSPHVFGLLAVCFLCNKLHPVAAGAFDFVETCIMCVFVVIIERTRHFRVLAYI